MQSFLVLNICVIKLFVAIQISIAVTFNNLKKPLHLHVFLSKYENLRAELNSNGCTGNSLSEGNNLVFGAVATDTDSDTPLHLKLPGMGDVKGETSMSAATSQAELQELESSSERKPGRLQSDTSPLGEPPLAERVFTKCFAFARLAN